MKTTMTWLLGLVMALMSGLAFANAKVHSMTGTVSAAVGPAPARAVKVGDTVPAGQTVVTAANSTVVLQFPDGQLAALTPNSRMTIEQYQFNEQQKSGNILLNLVSGGMRALTGLIGRTSPDKVSYKAATATIGVRGTDTTIAIAGTTVSVIVSGGSVTFSIPGVGSVTIPQGQGVVTSTTATTTTPAGQVVATTITVETVANVIAAIQAQAAANPALAATAAQITTALQSANSTAVQSAITSAATPNTSPPGTTTVTTTTQTGQQQTVITQPPTPTSP